MSSTSIAYLDTARTLNAIQQQRATGELTLAQDAFLWRLYFFQGRLVYATGTLHRVRRWRRAIKQQCPDFSMTFAGCDELWEYQLLSQSVVQGILSVAQAQAVIKTSLEEVLFSWVRNPILRSEWSAVQRYSFKENVALSLLLSSTQVEQVLEQAQQLWKHWKEFELDSLNPCQSPKLKKTFKPESGNAPTTLANLSSYLTGRYSLWDIASYTRRPVSIVTRFLLPWVRRGAIVLEDIADLPNPFLQLSQPVSSGIPSYRPLIACMDDSPTVGQFVANVLEPYGYRVLKIQDPLSGIAILSKYRPDLILMDLIMPNASGYDVCSFLRKTPIFQNTPIIVLTSQSGFVDRTRAKLVGASDFLSKPPDPKTLLNLIRQHLQSVMSTVDQLTDESIEN